MHIRYGQCFIFAIQLLVPMLSGQDHGTGVRKLGSTAEERAPSCDITSRERRVQIATRTLDGSATDFCNVTLRSASGCPNMSDDISRIDEELRKLQAQRDEAIAKARRAEERKAREASKILVGSTPKKKGAPPLPFLTSGFS